MNTNIKKIEEVLENFYKNPQFPSHLADSATYSLLAGGKRIRPVLLLAMLEAYGITLKPSHFEVAATVEMIHTGSLIHDDLPAMDNDDYRRGKLTNHKKFDEATAILAGDSLFLDPYYVLANCGLPAVVVVDLVKELAYASGSFGMVAGQVLDMDGEGQKLELEQIEQIHRLKTGRMLTFPFVASGIIAGKSSSEIEKLRSIGQTLGLAFQVRDDILDVTSSFEEIGKTPGKDVLEEKSTYVAHLGLDGAKTQLSGLLIKTKKDLSALTEIDVTEIYPIIDHLALS
ncbi:polyprenyl synthetase family protein [Lactococcus sp.]|uniref:polyprenyl synthetase family protein n=1 Tax=Lactococcus sp. TaxID=44273 RepID=UPI0035B0763C